MPEVKSNAIAQRPLLAELMGTALPVTVVVGSGVAARRHRAGVGSVLIAAQLVGGLVGLGLVRFFFPDAPATAGRRPTSQPRR